MKCSAFPHRLISCILSCIILLLLVIVHVSAGWAVYNIAMHPVYLGIWSMCTEENCSSLKVREVNLDLIRSFMVIATISCFLAILCSVQWDYFFNCTRDNLPQGLIAAICNIITGISVLIAVVIFDIAVVYSKPPQTLKLPRKWAFYLACVICVLSFLTGIYDLIVCKLSLWREMEPKPDSEAAPE